MAYGARLESVLGASPRGFDAPILRVKGLIPNPEECILGNWESFWKWCRIR